MSRAKAAPAEIRYLNAGASESEPAKAHGVAGGQAGAVGTKEQLLPKLLPEARVAIAALLQKEAQGAARAHDPLPYGEEAAAE